MTIITMTTYDEATAIAKLISSKISIMPVLGIVCGTGLGDIANVVKDSIIIPYSEIPNFPKSTVIGHSGNFVIGRFADQPAIVMQGRFHLYEGYEPTMVTLPIRVMQILGVKQLIITNAAGGINPSYKINDIVIIKDHINLMALTNCSPLTGPNDSRNGERFIALTDVYDKETRKLALQVADDVGISGNVHQGVYVCVSGPCFETPAELRMMKLLGGDLVGMSTAHEVVVAVHGGIKVFGLSLVTNLVVMDEESSEKANHQEVLESATHTVEKITKFIQLLVKRIYSA